MVSVAETRLLDVAQSMRPKPFSQTAEPLRPTTTAAPGKPPALIPRVTTRSMVSRRLADMPTVAGAATGNPPSTVATIVTTAISAVSMQPSLLKYEDVPAAPEERQDYHTKAYLERTCNRGGMFQRSAANRHIIVQSPLLARRGPSATVTLRSCNVSRRWSDAKLRCQQRVMDGDCGLC